MNFSPVSAKWPHYCLDEIFQTWMIINMDALHILAVATNGPTWEWHVFQKLNNSIATASKWAHKIDWRCRDFWCQQRSVPRREQMAHALPGYNAEGYATTWNWNSVTSHRGGSGPWRRWNQLIRLAGNSTAVRSFETRTEELWSAQEHKRMRVD